MGNGEILECSNVCQQVDMKLGSLNFSADLFVLPLSCAELVLGVQWLKKLGPVLTDYNKLTMQFLKDGKVVQLVGEPKLGPEEASLC